MECNKECKEEFREIYGSIRGVESYMAKIDKTLAINTRSLEEHIKRTELLEKKVEQQAKFLNMALGAWIILQVLLPFLFK